MKNQYINGNFRRLAYSFTQDFVNKKSVYNVTYPTESEDLRQSNSEANIEQLMLKGAPTSTDEEEESRINQSIVQFENVSSYQNLNASSTKCKTLGCNGSGSSRKKANGSYYKTHTSLDNCPRKAKISELLDYEDDIDHMNKAGAYQIRPYKSDSSDNDEDEINNLSLSDEINMKFAVKTSNIINKQASIIKELEKSIVSLGNKLSEQETR